VIFYKGVLKSSSAKQIMEQSWMALDLCQDFPRRKRNIEPSAAIDFNRRSGHHHNTLEMPPTLLRYLARSRPTICHAIRPSSPVLAARPGLTQTLRATLAASSPRTFTSTARPQATFMQVLRGCRQEQKARKNTSPQMSGRSCMKGVCLRVGTTKPKKPNSGERKVARVRLTNGTEVWAYIPGEGESVGFHNLWRRTDRS
jgi:hypothetical protein